MAKFFRCGSIFAVLTLTVVLAGISSSPAQSPAASSAPVSLDQLAPQGPAFSATMNVGCGDLDKTSCAIVLPKINGYSSAQGLKLVPVSSGGSVQSAQLGVCPGTIPSAFGMADGFDSVLRLPQCQSSFVVVGQPLFPYFGYLIAASSNPAASLDDLIKNVPSGKTVLISVGKVGTGGWVTFGNMLATNPTYKRMISEDEDDKDTSLSKVLSGAIDGYFIMDSPGSPLIVKVMSQTDASGNPLFKFLDVRPGIDFYGLVGVDHRPLYQEVTIKPGTFGFGAVKTVSTDGEIILNSAWAKNQANAQAINILVQAQGLAESAILAASHSPADWTGQPPQ